MSEDLGTERTEDPGTEDPGTDEAGFLRTAPLGYAGFLGLSFSLTFMSWIRLWRGKSTLWENRVVGEWSRGAEEENGAEEQRRRMEQWESGVGGRMEQGRRMEQRRRMEECGEWRSVENGANRRIKEGGAQAGTEFASQDRVSEDEVKNDEVRVEVEDQEHDEDKDEENEAGD